MTWDDFIKAARAISWITYLATTAKDGKPHVAPVSVGFTEGTVWFASRRPSRKIRNLGANPFVAFHWPVGTGSGPGELFARGTSVVHIAEDDRHRLWSGLDFAYDLAMFFQSPDNPDLAFVEVAITHASLLGPDFARSIWRPPAGSADNASVNRA